MSSVDKGAELYRLRHRKAKPEAETATADGTAARGQQLWRQRRQGVRIERGSDDGTDVTPRGSDAA